MYQTGTHGSVGGRLANQSSASYPIMCAILACRYLVRSLCFSNIITAIANTIIDFSVATRYNYFIYETARFEWRRRHEGKL